MKQKVIIWGVISLLVVFNLIRWWPNDNPDIHTQQWQNIKTTDLVLNGVTTSNNKFKYHGRNPFLPYDLIEKKLVRVESETPVKAASYTPKEKLSVSGLKLVGVVKKKSTYEAFILYGEDAYNATLNQVIGGRYKIVKIDIASVKLKDIVIKEMFDISLASE